MVLWYRASFPLQGQSRGHSMTGQRAGPEPITPKDAGKWPQARTNGSAEQAPTCTMMEPTAALALMKVVEVAAEAKSCSFKVGGYCIAA